MPITIDCPNCDKTLRINDSAAGKKVKCPKCQESFRVPAEPVEEDEPAEEEEAAEERPTRREKPKKSSKSKGKSKKKAGNKSLVLGLGIGGGVLVLLLIGGIIWWAMRDKGSDSGRGRGAALAEDSKVRELLVGKFVSPDPDPTNPGWSHSFEFTADGKATRCTIDPKGVVTMTETGPYTLQGENRIKMVLTGVSGNTSSTSTEGGEFRVNKDEFDQMQGPMVVRVWKRVR